MPPCPSTRKWQCRWASRMKRQEQEGGGSGGEGEGGRGGREGGRGGREGGRGERQGEGVRLLHGLHMPLPYKSRCAHANHPPCNEGSSSYIEAMSAHVCQTLVSSRPRRQRPAAKISQQSQCNLSAQASVCSRNKSANFAPVLTASSSYVSIARTGVDLVCPTLMSARF